MTSNEYPIIILFHAHWCPHCVDFIPSWNKIGKVLSSKGINYIKLEQAEVSSDSELSKLLASRNIVIRGYPTIINVGKNIIEEYSGPRDMPNIVKWAMV